MPVSLTLKRSRVRRLVGLLHVHTQHDLPFGGELDGVAQDIQQDLAKPPGIAKKPPRVRRG